MTLDTLHTATPNDPTVPKAWWKSRTNLLGIGLTAAGIATYLADPAHTPAMNVASISEAVGGILAIVLRTWFTTAPIAGTPAAAKVETAKQDIAIHAAVSATAPEAGPLSVDDIGRLLEQIKKERDDRNALLDKAAAMASAPPATMPPSPSTLSAVPPPAVTTP